MFLTILGIVIGLIVIVGLVIFFYEIKKAPLYEDF